MAYALVGTIGTVATGTNTTVNPTFGTGENRTANNLLIAWIAIDNSTTLPGTPATWTRAISRTGTSTAVAVDYKIASGGDAAPSYTSAATIAVQLAEFSGNRTTGVEDQEGTAAGTTSPQTATTAGADTALGELVISAATSFYSMSATKTTSHTFNNGASDTETSNDATSTASHYNFAYGITTSNAAADSDAYAFTTTNITGSAVAIQSFKLQTSTSTSSSSSSSSSSTVSTSSSSSSKSTSSSSSSSSSSVSSSSSSSSVSLSTSTSTTVAISWNNYLFVKGGGTSLSTGERIR